MNIFKKSEKDNKPAPTEDKAQKDAPESTLNPHDNGGCCGHCGGQDK